MVRKGHKAGDGSDSEASTVRDESPPRRGGGKKKGSKQKDGSDEDEANVSLSSLLDDMTEKRSATRTAALRGIIELLRSNPLALDEEECEEKLVESMLHCIKKCASASEALLAANALSLAFISLEDGGGKYIEDVLPQLGLQLKSCKHPTVRGSMAETIGILAFCAGEDDLHLLSLMRRLSGYVSERKEVSVECLRSWGLLASGVSDSCLVLHIEALLETLEASLESADADIRMSAAECVALIYEASWRCASDEDLLHDESTGEPALSESAGSDGESRSVKQTKKGERVKEKRLMRSAMATVEAGNGCPKEKLKIKGSTIVIDTWRGRKRLAALRRVLQGGFQAHMAGNQLLQYTFGISVMEDVEGMPGGEVGGVTRAGRQLQCERDRERGKMIAKGRLDRARATLQEELVEGFPD